MAQSIANKFVLPGKAQSLVASMRQILDFVSNNLPQRVAADDVYFKLRVIITELLSNALKHVTNAASEIQVFIDHEHIIIEKTDYGNPFKPNNNPDLINPALGKITQISKDAMHLIYAVGENEDSIKFVYKELGNNEAPNINEIAEHFGLLIIIKAADEFTYSYKPSSGLNTFRVVIKLH